LKINYQGTVERFKAIDAKELDFDKLSRNLFTDESIKTAFQVIKDYIQ
jgi:hypothetical protein